MYAENEIEFSRKWKIIQVKLKENFDILTNEDLLYIEGRRGAMMNRIQQRLNKTQAEMYDIIIKLERDLNKHSNESTHWS